MFYHVKRSIYTFMLSNRLDLYNHSCSEISILNKFLKHLTSPAILVHGRIITNVTPMLVDDLQRAAGKVTSTSEHHQIRHPSTDDGTLACRFPPQSNMVS